MRPFLPTVYLASPFLTWATACWLKRFVAYYCKRFTRVGAFADPSWWLPLSSTTEAVPWQSTCWRDISFLPFAAAPMTTISLPFSIGIASEPYVSTRDNASVAWCSIPTQCATPNSTLDRWRLHRSNLPVLSTRLGIYFKQSWFIRMEKLFSSRYGCIINTGHAIVRHSRWVVSYAFSGVVRDLDNTLPVWTLYAAAPAAAHAWFGRRTCLYRAWCDRLHMVSLLLKERLHGSEVPLWRLPLVRSV